MKLPLLCHPMLKSILDLAFPVDILQSNGLIDEETLLYYAGQLYAADKNALVAFSNNQMMANHLFFDSYVLNTTAPDLTEQITAEIQKGRYVFTFLDEFYIPGRYTYQRNHYMHGNLIFGYDDVQKQFAAAAYTNRGKYEETTFSYEEFAAAVNTDAKEVEPLSFIYVLRPKAAEGLPKDSKIWLYYIQAYYHSFDVMGQKTDTVYGINALEEMAKRFSVKTCRIASLYAIKEHKVLTQKRLRMLYERGLLTKDYSECYRSIVNDADAVIALWLRYRMTKNGSLEEKMREKLFEMIHTEKQILSECLNKTK